MKKTRAVTVVMDAEFHQWLKREASRLKLTPESYLQTLAKMDRKLKERKISEIEPDAGEE